jgi:hypothetical protein
MVNGFAVDMTKVVVSGTHVVFPVPAAAGTIYAGNQTLICVKVVNPTAAGVAPLTVDYQLSCCSEVSFGCGNYTVIPATSTYDFFWDSSPTYEGLAQGFIPPFKACGQNLTGALQFESGKFANLFNLILKPTLVGCTGPCTQNVTVTLNLTAAPAGAKVSLGLGNTTAITNNLTLGTVVTVYNVSLSSNTTISWNSTIHFDTVSAPGVYTICLKAFCPPGAGSCELGCNPQGSYIADECFNIKVYQWKDAAKITLKEKWNLISLPLVPLADPPIADVLKAIPQADRDNIISIWHYNRCTNKWAVYPTPASGQEALTQLVDGEAYWVRVAYPIAPLTPTCGNITLWVWGTVKPMPPAAPADYKVCEGWNMVGFLGTAAMNASAYLWNWGTPTPVVYGWDQGCWNVQNWNLINGTETLLPGQGYWVAFPAGGDIFVP